MPSLTSTAPLAFDWNVCWRGRDPAPRAPLLPSQTHSLGQTAARTPAEELAADLAEDGRWVLRIQNGDETAARAMVDRLYPTVMRTVRSHLPRRTLEQDLAQMVFVKVFSKLDQFSGKVPLEHWVARIAVNTCLNQLKHEAIRPELRMSDLSEDQETVVAQLASSREDLPWTQRTAARELVELMLERLSPEDRLVITLLHLEERSTEEISRLTGWSISWVKVRAFRARQKMRDIWTELFREESR
jgi:RNA polymerase sigma-70 factor (ECF subfamily)